MDAENRCPCAYCARNFKYIRIVERDVKPEDQVFMKETLDLLMNIEQDNEWLRWRLRIYPRSRGFVSEVKKLLAEYEKSELADYGNCVGAVSFVEFIESRLSDE